MLAKIIERRLVEDPFEWAVVGSKSPSELFLSLRSVGKYVFL